MDDIARTIHEQIMYDCMDAEESRWIDRLRAELAECRSGLAATEALCFGHEDHIKTLDRKLAEIVSAGEEAANLLDDAAAGNYKPDSLSSQPLRAAIDALEREETDDS